ncbi:MAG: hypothetical protein J6L64_02715 [Opitutales bacterium]|nr:hypothetical protein [Opitutales bacterium]
MGLKKLLVVAFAFVSVAAFAVTGASDSARRKALARGLYGRIQFVNAMEDYKVRFVTHGFEDLKVRYVLGDAKKPGQWKIVQFDGDFRVRIVDTPVEDLRIRIVEDGFEGPAN